MPAPAPVIKQDYRGVRPAKEGIVSQRNGDKARFGKQRQSKLLRRKRLREAWKAMSHENTTTTIQAEPGQGGNNIATLGAQEEHIVVSARRKSYRVKS
jgi:hypothetical protein